METIQASEDSLRAGEALALHLRRHPESALRPAKELATEFGLSEDFVEEVLERIRQPRPRPPREAASPFGWLRRLGRATRTGFGLCTEKPILFVFVTLSFGIAALAMPYRLNQGTGPPPDLASPSLWQSALLFGIGVLHLLCYFRHARVRHALVGSLVFWLTLAATNMVVAWTAIRELPEGQIIGELLFVALRTMIVASQYALLATAAAILGGLSRLRWLERQERHLSRHRLLERLFEIQGRMSGVHVESDETDPLWRQRWATNLRKGWFGWCLLAGAAFGTTYLTMLAVFGVAMPANPRTEPILAVGYGTFYLLELVLLASIGFLAAGWIPALLGAWIYQVGSVVPYLIPIRGFGGAFVAEYFTRLETIIPLTLMTTLIPAIAVLGARVDEKVSRERRLQRNEPAALLAEMVRIQWLLAPNSTDVCLMVVDAARSAEMKAAADPLVVEFSFREYQELIRRIAEEFDGHIHSTAGDGAVAAFADSRAAFAAARKLQTEIERFNREVNRLTTPFRLRIGLHQGCVAGDLQEVQFSEVIDIAAHVQAAAPVGGITLTEAVAEQHPDARLAPLMDPVDGQKVFLALDPTADE